MSNELKDNLGIIIGPNEKFSRFYIKQLVELGIDRLLITKTNKQSQEDFKKFIKNNNESLSLNKRNVPIDFCIASSPISFENGLNFLQARDNDLDYYIKNKKVFLVITAKDRIVLDDIHPLYAESLAKHSNYILCEKPFSNSQSFEQMKILNHLKDFSLTFGLNLQMSYVRNILKENNVNGLINKINWSSNGNIGTIVSDLLPHVFSLLEDSFSGKLIEDNELSKNALKRKNDKKQIGIYEFNLKREFVSIPLQINIDANNTGIRGFEIKGDSYLISPSNSVLKYDSISLEKRVDRESFSSEFKGFDFLKQSILDIKNGKPVCSLERTIQCENFLKLFR